MKKINAINPLFLIRLAVATIFLTHSLHGVFNQTVNAFGESYLNTVGFAPFGVILAWIMISFEIIGSVLLILGKFLRFIVPVFCLILITGIVLVHYPDGWYVVGPGRNGMEFSFVLLVSLIAILLQAKKIAE
ncbi:putative oxidoreductase [Pedobacter cryoconitis]|uniref:Putative oxidoreductase n=1 Tax=Pedobacter cryoconitis TaxID=188932 RepID=A0A7W8ZJI3_9SPHI|nr:DoxX family protein [Pedobacter cryoconitis]MBB5635157.1 putative oxidoreductase [Pedobacter cryoconitis]MBB6271659.1 putative oxidoreductase [Pedobacter cryoconitis]